MDDTGPRLEQRRQLTSVLIAEYAGALPPWHVRAAVSRADHDIPRRRELSAGARMAMVESSARRRLTHRLAETRDDVPATVPRMAS